VTLQPRARLAQDLSGRLAAAIRGAQLYSPGHPLIKRNVTTLVDALNHALDVSPSIAIGIVGEQLVVGEIPVARSAETMGELMHRLQRLGIERIVIDRGVEAGEVEQLVETVARADPQQAASLARLPHVRVGQLEIGERVALPTSDSATFRQLYQDAVQAAGTLWESAAVEGEPDADAARETIESLAQAVGQNRAALLSLTALKNYDNYTFTHMVNVSILTMGQARGLGIEGRQLREFGLAGLMHDIGKVKTPAEILHKTDKLTDGEFSILKRHPVDGAEILRATAEMPVLASIVAFEHHMRADGTGYPAAERPALNLATTLCGIADVYDAMRSQRAYQQAFPTDRILAVLKRNDGAQFDQRLVQRFVHLLGIYPVGNLVRLDTGELAVVREAYPGDPYRPHVRVVIGPDGARLAAPFDLDLSEQPARPRRSIVEPVDPADCGIDPLAYL
jgi:putative nucleotidyltransferase with HDIG domain